MDRVDPPPANSSDSELFEDAEDESGSFPAANPSERDDSSASYALTNPSEEPDDDDDGVQKPSIISEMRKELNISTATKSKSSSTLDTAGDDADGSKSDASSKQKTALPAEPSQSAASQSAASKPEEGVESSHWRQKKKHIFVLSDSGKPIYSLHGNENSLANLYGIIQALVSFVEHGEDTITSIHANGIKFVFLMRCHLILVAASRTKMSVQQLQMQLHDVYNQILSSVTYDYMNNTFQKRKNFDLRRCLEGTEHVMKKLLSYDKVDNDVFTFLTNTIRVLPLAKSTRTNIVSTIQSNCSKIKGLMFALLIADNKLIVLVRKKECNMHPSDLRILFNLVNSTRTFMDFECFRPICLPKLDRTGFVTAYASYLSEDCQACLLLLYVNPDAEYSLREAKRKITEKLRRSNCLQAINEELRKTSDDRMNFDSLGLTDLRHFMYKPRGTAQLLCSDIVPPYTIPGLFDELLDIHCKLLHCVHNPANPMKLVYRVTDREVVLAWMTAGYELYAVFEPLVNRSMVIKQVDKLIKSIEKEYDTYFIRTPYPTF